MILTKLFSRRWWFVTIFVISGVIVLARLGFWQIDRLEERKAFNQLVAERWNQTPFDVNQDTLPAEMDLLGYRRIQVTGSFDYANQVVLKNQNRDSIPGVGLVTPLILPDGRAMLVSRGWIPLDQSMPEQWTQFNEAPAEATVVGLFQQSQLLAGAPPPDSPQTQWFRIDIAAIQQQLPYELMPVFLAQLPEPGRGYEALPYREVPPGLSELSEGNHFSYALQWFMFAAILGGGYLPYIHYQEQRRQRLKTIAENGGVNPDAPLDVPAMT